MTLTFIHGRLANTAVIFSAICALWGIVVYLRKQNISSSYWGTLAIAELLMLAQAVIGFILMAGGGVPGRGNVIHLLYGITSIISLPAAYLYSNGRDTWREALLYGITCLWLFGIAMRGISTGVG
jgi:hypothetical protein